MSVGAPQQSESAGNAARDVRRSAPEPMRVVRQTAKHLDCAAGADPMHVLFCASPSYLQHVAVAAVSLLESSHGRPVVLHVMMAEEGPSAEAKLLESLRPYADAGLEFYRVGDARLSRAFVDRYVTKEAYLRLLAPDVLPAELDRRDLPRRRPRRARRRARALERRPPGRAVGAVAECDWLAGTEENRLTRLGIPNGHVYVNSGVLVMDLGRWRRDRLAERLFRFIEDRGSELTYFDQDALNAVLQKDIALLDRRWNVQVMLFSRWIRTALPADYSATRDACRRPGVIHYTTGSKPWNFRSWTRKRALYYRFLDKTAWRHDNPALQTSAQRLEHRFARALLKLGLDPYFILPVWARLSRRLASGRD